MTAVTNLINLSNVQDEKAVQKSLSIETTDTKRYEGDYRRFKEYCQQNNKEVASRSLVHYLNHSLTVEKVKKNTFNRRYFAIKKMMLLDDIALDEQDANDIKQLRKLFKTDEHGKQNAVQGKSAKNSDDVLDTISQLDDKRAVAICLVALYTGNRPIEMVQLKVSDFRLDANEVDVYLKKQRTMHTKRLPQTVVKAVKEYMREYQLQADDYFIGAVNRHKQYSSKEISTTAYSKMLDKWLSLSGYNLRKTLVSHMHNKGADLPTIAIQTGHSSIKTLHDHYLKVDTQTVDKYL